jgi:hypothetical protein
MCANELRLWTMRWCTSFYAPIGLKHTQFAEVTCGTIRLKPLNIGALVHISVRRIKIAIACTLLGRPAAVPPGTAPFRCNPRERGYRRLDLKIACTSVTPVTSRFDLNAHDRLAPRD